MLVWRRIEEEVTEDGSETSKWVECKGEEDHVVVQDVADNVVAGDWCVGGRITLVHTA
jgi:hypothetical protein